ncbi:MAG: zinc-ribbon domain-containing protein [Bacteroidota bacterium]
MKFCSNCGTELLPNANFCPACGNKINSLDARPTSTGGSSFSSSDSSDTGSNGSTQSEDISSNSNANEVGSTSSNSTAAKGNSNNKSSQNDGSFTPTQKKILIVSLVVFLVVILSIVGFSVTRDSDGRPTADSLAGVAVILSDDGAVTAMDSTSLMGMTTDGSAQSADNSATTEKNMSIRNNWEDYIIASRSGFNYSELGGISDLSIIITNKTEYVMDRVFVDVDIKTANGYTYKTEHLYFEQVKPYSRQEQMVPPTTRGKTVEYRITNIYSNSLNFKWDEGDNTGNGSLNDPWKSNE